MKKLTLYREVGLHMAGAQARAATSSLSLSGPAAACSRCTARDSAPCAHPGT
jgi:hypothetical protein